MLVLVAILLEKPLENKTLERQLGMVLVLMRKNKLKKMN